MVSEPVKNLDLARMDQQSEPVYLKYPAWRFLPIVETISFPIVQYSRDVSL